MDIYFTPKAVKIHGYTPWWASVVMSLVPLAVAAVLAIVFVL